MGIAAPSAKTQLLSLAHQFGQPSPSVARSRTRLPFIAVRSGGRPTAQREMSWACSWVMAKGRRSMTRGDSCAAGGSPSSRKAASSKTQWKINEGCYRVDETSHASGIAREQTYVRRHRCSGQWSRSARSRGEYRRCRTLGGRLPSRQSQCHPARSRHRGRSTAVRCWAPQQCWLATRHRPVRPSRQSNHREPRAEAKYANEHGYLCAWRLTESPAGRDPMPAPPTHERTLGTSARYLLTFPWEKKNASY